MRPMRTSKGLEPIRWVPPMVYARTASRNFVPPHRSVDFVGFRPAI
jgi:hypothetical protein